jgi:hypothetical protein
MYSLASILSIARPLFAVVVLSAQLFLAFMPFSYSEKAFNFPPAILLALTLVIAVIFICKPIVYSNDVTINGVFAEFFFSFSPKSIHSFIPFNGKEAVYPIAAIIKNTSSVSYRSHFLLNRLMTKAQPCFFEVDMHAGLPDFFPSWPPLKLMDRVFGNGRRRLIYQSSPSLPDLVHAVTLVFYCLNHTKCIDWWDRSGLNPINYIRTELSDFTAAINLIGFSKADNLTLEILGRDAMLVEVMYSVGKKSPARAAFMNNFGPYVRHSADGMTLGGSVFVQSLPLTPE